MEPIPEPDRPPAITVRTATIADADAITDAHVAAWQTAYRGIMPDRYLDDLANDRASRAARHRIYIARPDDPRTFDLVAEYDGDVVGWLSGGPSRDDDGSVSTGEVSAIYIHPDYWQGGREHAHDCHATTARRRRLLGGGAVGVRGERAGEGFLSGSDGGRTAPAPSSSGAVAKRWRSATAARSGP